MPRWADDDRKKPIIQRIRYRRGTLKVWLDSFYAYEPSRLREVRRALRVALRGVVVEDDMPWFGHILIRVGAKDQYRTLSVDDLNRMLNEQHNAERVQRIAAHPTMANVHQVLFRTKITADDAARLRDVPAVLNAELAETIYQGRMLNVFVDPDADIDQVYAAISRVLVVNLS